MAAKRDLLDGGDDESDGEPSSIKVNQQYARRYEHNKKREDLHRLQELQKQGLISNDESDSEEEDEDEDGRLPERTEVRIFDTLAKIKKKDPEIYKESVKFFDEEEEDEGETGEEPARTTKKKPIYLKDVAGQGGEESDEDEKPRSFKTYAEEQQELKDAVLKSIQDAEISDEEEGFLKVKKKSKQELETAEAEVDAEGKKKNYVVARTLEEYFGKDDNLDENDKFLKNYLLNEEWVEKEKGQVPSYEDVVGGVSEDEEEIKRQEQYEAAYNFRFEENAGSQVAGHSRIIENSVRKLPEKRKEQRKKKQERLLEAETARREELKRLKNLKKKEIMDKISKIKTVAGIKDLEKIAEDDLEEDFDPEKYDKKMKEAFGDDYYEQDDPGFHSDQDVDELFKPELSAAPEDSEMERDAKQEIEKKMEEYYKLDYEDMVGDLPTRFKYTQVKPDMYGLTTAQILDSDDKELNQYISLKFLAPYRTDDPVPRHKHYRMTKKERKRKAMDQTPTIKKQNEDNHTGIQQGTDKQPKKKKKTGETGEQQQRKTFTDEQQKAEKGKSLEQQDKADAEQENQKKKHRRRKKGLGLSETRLISYGKIQLPKRRKT